MSIEEQNVAVVRSGIQTWNDGTVATEGARYIAPGFVRHDLNGAWLNVADFHHMPSADYHRMLSIALAEMHLEIVDILGRGTACVCALSAQGSTGVSSLVSRPLANAWNGMASTPIAWWTARSSRPGSSLTTWASCARWARYPWRRRRIPELSAFQIGPS